jgi:hypothetical protein
LARRAVPNRECIRRRSRRPSSVRPKPCPRRRSLALSLFGGFQEAAKRD